MNRKEGSDATVELSEIKNSDPVKIFIIQVAALSWVATQVPETTVAIQSFLNAGFRSATQVELFVMIGDDGLHPVTKAAGSPSFRNFVPKHAVRGYCWWNTEFLVERDHDPPAEGAASFHTTRWTIVMRAAQNQTLGVHSALAELCRLYWYPLYMFARRRGHSPDDAQDLIQGSFLHLIASEGWLEP